MNGLTATPIRPLVHKVRRDGHQKEAQEFRRFDPPAVRRARVPRARVGTCRGSRTAARSASAMCCSAGRPSAQRVSLHPSSKSAAETRFSRAASAASAASPQVRGEARCSSFESQSPLSERFEILVSDVVHPLRAVSRQRGTISHRGPFVDRARARQQDGPSTRACIDTAERAAQAQIATHRDAVDRCARVAGASTAPVSSPARRYWSGPEDAAQ